MGSAQMSPEIEWAEDDLIEINQDIVDPPAATLHRVANHKAGRHYFRLSDDGNGVHLYKSVTTWLKDAVPTPYFLIEWYKDKGREADRLMQEAAWYGTFMHICWQQALVSEHYPISIRYWEERVKEYAEDKSYIPKSVWSKWPKKCVEDMLAFATWKSHYDIRLVASEIRLWSDTFKVAGSVDLVCLMRQKPKADGLPLKKEYDWHYALIDFKSGRHSVKDNLSYQYQLLLYKRMWDEHYPDKPIKSYYNWTPKNWRGDTPKFQFVNQTLSAKDHDRYIKRLETFLPELSDPDYVIEYLEEGDDHVVIPATIGDEFDWQYKHVVKKDKLSQYLLKEVVSRDMKSHHLSSIASREDLDSGETLF